MSLSKGLRALARAPVRTKALTAGDLIAAGYPADGTDVAEDYARNLSVVDRCVEILSDSMAKLPIYLFDSRTRERIDHPLLYLLNIRPNEAMAPSVAKKLVETCRLEGGNGYLWIVRSERTGRPQELIPVPWRLVQPWRDLAGRVWYDVSHPVTGEAMRLPQEDMIHMKGASRDGLTGVSVLRRASEAIQAARSQQQYGLSYFASGGQPSGVLRTESDLGGYAKGPDGKPLQRKDGSYVTKRDVIRQEWERVHMGPSNSHRVAILDLSLDYKPLAASNADAQFIESQDVSVKDLARYFGVPLYKLQEGKQSYSSNEQNAIEYVVGTLHPIVTQYEEELSYKLLTDRELRGGLEIRLNLMGELRGDSASRATWYKVMRETGAFSVNEIRALEDLPPVPGGDTHYASLNYVPLEDFRQLSTTRAESRQPAD